MPLEHYFDLRFNAYTPDSPDGEWIEAVSCDDWLTQLYGAEEMDEIMSALQYGRSKDWRCPKIESYELNQLRRALQV